MIKADGKEAPQEMQLFNIIIESTGINKLLLIMITQNIINMLVKFSSKDTATLCKGLNKLVNYNTSKPLSRFSDIPQYMRQKKQHK